MAGQGQARQGEARLGKAWALVGNRGSDSGMTKRTTSVQIRATPAEVKRWRAAAKALGLTLSAWLRMLATQASGKA